VDPQAVVLAFIERINEGDADRLAELMTEGFAFIDHDGTAERPREVMRENFRSYFESFPDYRIHVSRVVAAGDVVVLIGRTTGSHVPPEVEAEETVVWAAWTEGERVREWHILYADTEKARRLVGDDHGPL
jgi:predicted SnoaL-like aldol condensation-catalyzing enzyme